MKFSWDPKKAASNLKKHGVSFPDAQTVFDDPCAGRFPDEEHSTEDEEREELIGLSSNGKIVLVIFVERISDVEVRIISARPADIEDELEYWRRRG